MADTPLETRLAHLADLHAQGVLADDEYEAARAAAIAAEAGEQTLPFASPTNGPKGRLEPSPLSASGAHNKKGTWLTGIAIVLVLALVGLVAGVLLSREGDTRADAVPDAAAAASPSPAPAPTPEQAPPASSSLTFHQSCASDRVCPQITSLIGEDMGSKIQITLTYCDRTPGSYQGFVYRFALADSTGSELPWNTTQSATQSRACNTITADLNNNYSPGEYQVRASMSNTDTGQETTGQSDGFTIG